MKKSIFLFLPLVLLLQFTVAHAQEKDIVLVNGNPPLTQLMVGKTIVLLDWVLDLKLTKDQELDIKNVLINSWKKSNTAEIKSTLEVIQVYDRVEKLSEPERNKVKEKLQPLLLQDLEKDPDDDLSKIIKAAYASAHANAPRNTVVTTETQASVKSKLRVGADGFTGLYRMMRPKPLDINRSTYEHGYTIEHIVFLPDGNVFRSLPPEGLLYFDYSLACRTDPRDCGTYELKNGEIHIYLGPEKTQYVFTRNGQRINNAPELGKGSFRPIPAADGLKLEGNYRRHETEPSISFTQDGKFIDKGAFKNFGTIGRLDGSTFQDDGKGGSGTYLIEQNTLELKYSDGRIKRHVFVTFPENLVDKPAIKSFLLYEQRLERY